MSHRAGAAAIAVVLVAGALLGAGAAALGATEQQRFFRGLLLDDRRTGRDVRALLRDGGYVSDRVVFSDVTGDRRDDAVVTVSTGGAAGDVAFYVFSTDGRARSAELRAIHRQEGLYRVRVSVSRRVLTYRVPSYRPGDPICCPEKLVERDLRWNPRTKRFSVSATREIAPRR